MNELPGDPSLPPGVSLRDVDVWPFCRECDRETNPNMMDEAGRCPKCQRNDDEDDFPLADFKPASPAALHSCVGVAARTSSVPVESINKPPVENF